MDKTQANIRIKELRDIIIEASGVNMVRNGQLTADAGKLSLSGESNIIREGSVVDVATGVTLVATGTNALDSNTVSGSVVATSS